MQRAEYVMAGTTASGIDYRNVGRTTKPYDEKRAYFANIPRDAWVCLRVMEEDENNAYWRELYFHTLAQISRQIGRGYPWPDFYANLRKAKKWDEYRAKSRALIGRMVCLAVCEHKYREHFRHDDPSDKRAAFMGLKRRQWFAGGYSDAYKRVCMILDEWMGQARRTVWVNQLDLGGA
jgi:hypothetical protein